MRIRKRFVTLGLAAALSLAVGAIGFAVSASGHAGSSTPGSPPIPCPAAGAPPGGDNKSCIRGKITPSALPKTTFKPISLFTHVHTHYEFPGDQSNGGKAKTVAVHFDDNGTINLSPIPACTKSLVGVTPKVAMQRCKSSYLGATPTRFTGSAHAVATQAFPAGVRLCNLIFKGATNSKIILYSRAYLDNGGPSANCKAANPQTENSTGPTRTTVILHGTVTNSPIAGFGKVLTTTNIDTQSLPLDEFHATTKQGLKARCPTSDKILNVRGVFTYSGSGQPTDTANHTQACTPQ